MKVDEIREKRSGNLHWVPVLQRPRTRTCISGFSGEVIALGQAHGRVDFFFKYAAYNPRVKFEEMFVTIEFGTQTKQFRRILF